MGDDTRYAYAVARVRGMETRLLDRQWIERLLAEDAPGALKVLADSEYQESLTDIERPEDIERGLTRALAEALAVVSAISPEPALIDLFRLRWDFRNLKALVKAALLKLEEGEFGLAEGVGTVELPVLEKAASEMNFIALPQALAEVAREAAEQFRNTGELRFVERLFESGMWSHQLSVAEAAGNDFLLDFFRMEIDLTNIRTFIRVKDAGRDAGDLASAFIQGGTLDLSFFESHLGESTDTFARSLEYGRYGELAAVFRDWSRGRAHVLEIACDNLLLKHVESASTVAYGIEPLVAFILTKQIEVKLVRAAVVAKLDGVPRERVEERLRIIHV